MLPTGNSRETVGIKQGYNSSIDSLAVFVASIDTFRVDSCPTRPSSPRGKCCCPVASIYFMEKVASLSLPTSGTSSPSSPRLPPMKSAPSPSNVRIIRGLMQRRAIHTLSHTRQADSGEPQTKHPTNVGFTHTPVILRYRQREDCFS